jgi:glucokinase
MNDLTDDQKCWIGFDLGGTKMLATVFDDKFKIVESKRKRTKGYEGDEAGIERIIRTIDGALDEAEISPSQLGGIGIGCPGTIDLKKGVLKEAPNLGWNDVPLQEKLEKKYGCGVVLANDVDAGVFGEYCFGAGKAARCVLGVFPGTGIGGGCVYEGKLIQGSRTTCMEIGHIPMLTAGSLCGCGQSGCLETEASRLAISAEVAKAAYRGEAPFVHKKAGTELSEIRSGLLAEAVEKEKVVEKIVRRAAFQVGRGVATAINLLAPDIVVLGGGLVEAMPKLFVEEVTKGARAHSMPSLVESLKVTVAELGDDAGVMGSAAWARRVLTGSSGKEHWNKGK